MYPWPSSRGGANWGNPRSVYGGRTDLDWGSRNELLDNLWQRRVLGMPVPQYNQGYPGGWGGSWGQLRMQGMQTRFNNLQPGYVRPGFPNYGNAPSTGGFI